MSVAMRAPARLAEALGRFSARWVPSSFSIAVLLTFVAFGLGVGWGGVPPSKVLRGWGDGFFELLSFSMQMALVLFCGYLLALAPAVRRALEALASLATTPKRAVGLMAAASLGLALLNWGLSLVASAMLVRAIARRQPKVDYRLLVASAYFGMGATWHAGLSATAPLLVATPGHFLEAQLGVIPIDRTLLSPFNLLVAAASSVGLVFLAVALHPSPEETVRVDPALIAEPAPEVATESVHPLDRTWVLSLAFGLVGLAYWALGIAETGFRGLNLNRVIFLFLIGAVALHGTPQRLLRAAEAASGALHGVVLQFPLYAGIYGIFRASGLTERLGEAFVALSSTRTFPGIVYLYSGLVNYFVPSGGSKWAIEAPYLLEAARKLAVAPEKVVLAYAWGDMATDLLQPFWALPLLAVARLEFKDILGFLGVAFLAYFPLVTLAFFLWG